MSLSKAITIEIAGDEKDFVIKELTATEIRKLLKHAEDNQDAFDPVRSMFADISFSDIVSMSNATMAQLDKMKPSDIRKIADACKEVNTHFFAMVSRLTDLMKTLNESNPSQ